MSFKIKLELVKNVFISQLLYEYDTCVEPFHIETNESFCDRQLQMRTKTESMILG